jgi:hypothetical protein
MRASRSGRSQFARHCRLNPAYLLRGGIPSAFLMSLLLAGDLLCGGCRSSGRADKRAPYPLVLNLSLKTNAVVIGQPLILSVSISNGTSKAVLTRRLTTAWQWLDIADARGRDIPSVPSTLMVYQSLDTPEAFLVLQPGESQSRVFTYGWVGDDERSRDPARLGSGSDELALDTGGMWCKLTPGSYKVSVRRRVFAGTMLWSTNSFVTVDTHFGLKLALGEMLSRPQELVILPASK